MVGLGELLKKIEHCGGLRARGLKGEHLTPLMGPARSGDLDHSMADLAAITADLGWHPTVALEEGLGELIDAQLGHEV